MGKESLGDKIINWLNGIGWKLFVSTYPGGEDQYFMDIKEDTFRHRLVTYSKSLFISDAMRVTRVTDEYIMRESKRRIAEDIFRDLEKENRFDIKSRRSLEGTVMTATITILKK